MAHGCAINPPYGGFLLIVICYVDGWQMVVLWARYVIFTSYIRVGCPTR